MNEELVEAARHTGLWLQAHGLSLSTAESCTGGLIAAAMTEIAGSSAWFERGFVTYSNASKQELLGVSAATLDAYGAVSEETVREMAYGALQHSTADLAVAVSGIAGPGGGSATKPVGTICLAWSGKGGTLSDVESTTRHFSGDRRAVRLQTALLAIQFLTSRA